MNDTTTEPVMRSVGRERRWLELEPRFSCASAAVVSAVGANAAIVLGQIEFWTRHDRFPVRVGWIYATCEDLGHLTGLSVDQVKRATAKLLDAGLIERDVPFVGEWDRCPLWRSTGAAKGLETGPAIRSIERAEMPPSRTGDIARSSLSSNTQDTNTPLPPTGGTTTGDAPAVELEGQTSLLDAPEVVYRSEVRSRSKELDPVAAAAFEVWWSRYPSTGRGGRGSKAGARSAWARAIRAGYSSTELDRLLDNYRLARGRYHELTGGLAPLMGGSRFVRGGSEEFDRPLSDDDIRSRWPMPDGRPWPDAEPADGPPAHLRGDLHAMADWYDARSEEVAARG